MHQIVVAILALALGAGLTACDRIPMTEILAGARDKQEEEQNRDKSELEQAREDIYAMVGGAECETVADCRFIGLGDKPCGGPWEFLVYSVTQTDSVELADVVAEYNALEQSINQKHGYGSDCSVPNEPTLGVADRRCVDLGYQGGDPGATGDSLFVRLVDSPEDVPESHAYSLLDAYLHGDMLVVKVSHSGGCVEHEYALWAMPGPYMSPLPHYDLELTHRDPDDPCDGIVEAELGFILTPLREAHGGQALIALHLGDRTFELEPKWTDPDTRPDGTVDTPADTIAVPPFSPGADSLIVVNTLDDMVGTDPFWLGDVRIEGDILSLVVTYSGGCEEHEFALWTTPEYAESEPAQHGLFLTHNANGDMCEAAITQELRFDISPLKTLHPPDTQVVMIRVGSPIDSAGIMKEYEF